MRKKGQGLYNGGCCGVTSRCYSRFVVWFCIPTVVQDTKRLNLGWWCLHYLRFLPFLVGRVGAEKVKV